MASEARNWPLESYREYLRSLARLRLRAFPQGTLDPSDVVQQALLKAQKHRHQFRGQNEIQWRAYLRRILATTLADAVGDLPQERTIQESLDRSSARLEAWLVAEQSSPSQKAQREEQLLQLNEALSHLADDERTALELRYLQDPPWSLAVAKHLNRPSAKAVAGLLSRGLEKLRGLLRESLLNIDSFVGWAESSRPSRRLKAAGFEDSTHPTVTMLIALRAIQSKSHLGCWRLRGIKLMPLQGSVSRALEGLKAGKETAARELWERYCVRLTRQARVKLRHNRRRIANEDDIAQSAFLSLCLGARNGRFPALQDRDSLWRLLVFITAQKAADLIAYEKKKKRGEGKVHGHSFIAGPEGHGSFDAIAAQTPGPATLQIWAEEYERLLDRLKDDTLKKIAVWRLEGATIDEIADKLGCAHRTVDRKLDLIKKVLLAETKA